MQPYGGQYHYPSLSPNIRKRKPREIIKLVPNLALQSQTVQSGTKYTHTHTPHGQGTCHPIPCTRSVQCENTDRKQHISFQGAPWIPDYEVHLTVWMAQHDYKTKNTKQSSITIISLLMMFFKKRR